MNNEEHDARTMKVLKIKADRLHAWIDEPCKWLGADHRQERHGFDVKFPKWAIKKYGIENCVRIHFLHLIDDKILDLNPSWYGDNPPDLSLPQYSQPYEGGPIMYYPALDKRSE